MARAFAIFILLLLLPIEAGANGLELARAAQEAEAKGDFENAAALYTRAISAGDLAGGNLRDALHYRGNAKFFLGRFDEAAEDYQRSLKIDPKSVYVALWLHIARARAGQTDVADLKRRTAKLDLFYWPGPVVALFLGEARPDDVLKAAADPFLGKKGRLDQLCEANFYVGQYHLIAGRKQQSAELFRKAIETGAKDFVEYQAAQIELKKSAM